jgi:FkbM family methyltransferase
MRVPKGIRRFTDPVLERIPVPILGGANRGLWWNLASAGSGYASGRRAAPQMRCLASLMHAGDVFWDVGAHHGYVTLCAARHVGPTGSVHAFEPSARNRRLLARHVSWNGFRNVVIHPFALSSYNGEAPFGGTDTSKMLHLGGGTETVQVRTADSLVRSGALPAPSVMKVDVEGAEADLLQGAGDLLRRDARLVIAMHSRAVFAQCGAILRAAGNSLVESRALAACEHADWMGDPDLYSSGPTRIGQRTDADALRAVGF